MEFVSGLTIKRIFLDNGNWWKFFIKNKALLRPAIVINVIKILACRTKLLGFASFICTQCLFVKKIFFSCKSRFCSSCGKKATDQWIKTNFDVLPDTKWQHITFTMPDKLWDFFWLNRHLLNHVSPIAAGIIQELAAKKKAIPGIFSALHTFKRDLGHNVHLHLSTTCGGLSVDKKHWIKLFFHEKPIKTMWRYRIITLFREEYKAGNLKLPPHLKHIKNYKTFNSWLNAIYQKKWYVFLQKSSYDHKRNIEYLGKYLKRPPLGETRIKAYDGTTVTYTYLDYYHNTTETISLPVLDFIGRLVAHIPDTNFRVIRYYGWLSNRTRGKLLPLVFKLLHKIPKKIAPTIKWRELFIKTFGLDPLLCPSCHCELLFSGFCFGRDSPTLLLLHQSIALPEYHE